MAIHRQSLQIFCFLGPDGVLIFGVTFGYLINAFVCICLSTQNMDENMKIQYVSCAFLITSILQISGAAAIRIWRAAPVSAYLTKYLSYFTNLSNSRPVVHHSGIVKSSDLWTTFLSKRSHHSVSSTNWTPSSFVITSFFLSSIFGSPSFHNPTVINPLTQFSPSPFSSSPSLIRQTPLEDFHPPSRQSLSGTSPIEISPIEISLSGTSLIDTFQKSSNLSDRFDISAALPITAPNYSINEFNAFEISHPSRRLSQNLADYGTSNKDKSRKSIFVRPPGILGQYQYGQLLSTFIASYSYVNVIPSWANEMTPGVKVGVVNVVVLIWRCQCCCCCQCCPCYHLTCRLCRLKIL